jgi:uncharacterized protein YggE
MVSFRKVLFAFVISLFVQQNVYAQEGNSSGEISVSAFAYIENTPRRSHVYFLLVGEGESAATALAMILEKEKSFLQAASSISFQKDSENLNFSGSSANSLNRQTIGQIKPSSRLRAEKSIELVLDDNSQLAKIIDVAAKSNIDLIQSIENVPTDNSEQTSKAISKAIAKAKSKAQIIAKDLGVKIGKMISTSVTEESQSMASLRGNKVGGMRAVQGSTRPRVLVQTRFETL